METKKERAKKAFATLMDMLNVEFQPDELYSVGCNDFKHVKSPSGRTVQVYGDSTRIYGGELPEIFVGSPDQEEYPAVLSISVSGVWYNFDREGKLLPKDQK